jgi:hypothetical protein
MADDEVTRNLEGMDELDFTGWNRADWHGVFARYHTGQVLATTIRPPPSALAGIPPPLVRSSPQAHEPVVSALVIQLQVRDFTCLR